MAVATTTARTSKAASVLADYRDHLDGVRRAIQAELRDYPRPVAGCDQQFNHLLEQRQGIQAELGHLDALSKGGALGSAEVEALDRLIAASPFLDDDARRTLRSGLS